MLSTMICKKSDCQLASCGSVQRGYDPVKSTPNLEVGAKGVDLGMVQKEGLR